MALLCVIACLQICPQICAKKIDSSEERPERPSLPSSKRTKRSKRSRKTAAKRCRKDKGRYVNLCLKVRLITVM